MNLPNKLTLLRVFMVPLFLVLVFVREVPNNLLWAAIVFALASATDALDGHLARKNNLVTSFGKFLDPLADKVLVMAALISLVELNLVSCIPVIIILTREFTVTALRLVASGDVVIAAGIWGKLKTAFTMIAIVAIFGLHAFGIASQVVDNLFIWVATILTVISGAQYLWAYRKYIDTTK